MNIFLLSWRDGERMQPVVENVLIINYVAFFLSSSLSSENKFVYLFKDFGKIRFPWRMLLLLIFWRQMEMSFSNRIIYSDVLFLQLLT